MILYILIFLFIIGYGLLTFSTNLYQTNKQKAINRYINVVCVVLALFSGLRNLGVGEDTYGYYLGYVDIQSTPWKQLFFDFIQYIKTGEGKDVGFPLFVKATQLISAQFQFFLIFVAVFFYAFFLNFLKKNCTTLIDVVLSFTIFYVLFYYIFSMTAIRQSITLAITLYCYEFVKKKRIIPFLLLLLLFSTVHKSILIYIPFYFLCRLKSTKYLFPIVLISFPIIMTFKNTITFFLLGVGGYDEYEEFDGAGTLTFTSIFLLISLVAYLRREKILKIKPISENYYKAFALALFLLPLSWINPALLRITMYFSIFMIMLIPEVIKSFQNLSNQFRRGITVFTIGILFVLFIRAGLAKENSEYSFYWEKVKLGKNYE